MKIAHILAASVLIAGSSLSQQPPATQPVPKEKAQAQVTFHVVTDDGKPVANVDVTASTFLYWDRKEGFGKDVYQDIKGRTDKDGMTTITFASERGDVHYGIHDVPGYYPTWNLEYQFKEIKDGKWQPWNPILELEFKPILKPIPMYARKKGAIKPFAIPAIGQPVGFDMMAGDWVAPHGKGSVSDMLFTLTEKVPYVSAEQPFDVTLTVTFTNKGDGIQSVLVPLNRGSEFRLPRYAPEDGYEPQLVKEIAHATGEPIASGTREDQNYFVRVRTVLDEKGKVQSALYAKIDGDIQFWGNRKTRFTYYLNPNPNDRNMEFDLKQNLAGDLPFNERVTKP